MSVISGPIAANKGAQAQTDSAHISADAATTAAQAGLQAQREALGQQKDIYGNQLNLDRPFYNTGIVGNALLQSAVTGKPVQYADPTFRQLTQMDLAPKIAGATAGGSASGATAALSAPTGAQQGSAPQFTRDPDSSDANPVYSFYNPSSGAIEYTQNPDQWVKDNPNLLVADKTYPTADLNSNYNLQRLPGVEDPSNPTRQLDPRKTYYQGPNGAIVEQPPMLTANFDPAESPAAKYEEQMGTRSLSRQLAARGLLGSGNAAQRLGELSSGIAANDWNQQYGRLLDMVKVGTGASASAGSASQQLGNQIGQNAANVAGINANMAGQVGSAALAAGQAQAGLYGGLGGASTRALNTGINAYNAYKGSGNNGAFDGSYGSGGFGTSAANSEGSTWTANDISNASY